MTVESCACHYTATLLKDGTVLVTGGLAQYGIVLAEAELYQ